MNSADRFSIANMDGVGRCLQSHMTKDPVRQLLSDGNVSFGASFALIYM